MKLTVRRTNTYVHTYIHTYIQANTACVQHVNVGLAQARSNYSCPHYLHPPFFLIPLYRSVVAGLKLNGSW